MNKRKYSLRLKTTSMVVLLSQLFQLIYPTVGFALTGGPSQPEVQSFEPVGTSEMVDLFSGDFNYNIPLMDVGGYPINIAYHAGTTMDQEASWTGLGWNINAGVINREMRGLPDDFKGDIVKKEFKMRPNRSYGLAASLPIDATKLFGLKVAEMLNISLSLSLGVNYNNYKGLGVSFGATPTFGISTSSSSKLNAKLGINYSTSGGVEVSPNLSFSANVDEVSSEGDKYDIGFGASVGTSFNSRYGLQSLNYGLSQTSQKQGIASTSKDAHNEKKKNKYGAHGASVSGSHSFGIKTYTPTISMPMKTHAFSLTVGFGADFTGIFANFSFTGSYSQQKLAVSETQKPAYGYLYEHAHPKVENIEDHDFLLDFNREKDGSYSKKTTNLPLTTHTYDIYSVSGHGVGGSYRPFRSDIGIVGDDYGKNTSTSANGGIEIGAGNITHWGASLNMVFHKSETGAWTGNKGEWYESSKRSYKNITRDIFGFRDIELGQTTPDYEPSYFKKSGEMSSIDDANYQVMRGNLPVAPDPLSYENSNSAQFFTTQNVKPSLTSTSTYKSKNFVFGKGDKNNVIRKKRDKRNETFNPLNNGERIVAGHTKYMNPSDINPPINRYLGSQVLMQRPEHHTSEITILGEDGMRYIYGIPAYNNSQKEKTFNVAGRNKNNAIGQATYVNNSSYQDNSTNNKRGRDDFYSSVETPGYAHSYLLTGIVSNDYVDIGSNGITDDDFGTSVKVNYARVQQAYRWRIPYNEKSVSLAEGLRSTHTDDKGTYVYGTKEIWHMSTIESKTHVAFFRISQREDALGVAGEDGGKDVNMRSYKLDRIELYSKQEIQMYRLNAKPVKVVNFEYEYSLCPNVDNNSGSTTVAGNANKGKLTLKKIWFSYGSSHKGRTAPYIFEYAGLNSQPGINPAYNLKGNDAWGSYKPMLPDTEFPQGNLSNSDYPYTDGNSANSNQNAYAWALTQIQLPSGGKIKVSYEADDYGYVENKRAMEMFRIKGFGWADDHANKGNRLYGLNGKNRHTDLIFFQLSEPYTGSDPSGYIRKRYLEGIKYLQFTLHANIKDGKYEYVKGYCEIDWTKGCGISNGEGWVAIKEVSIKDRDNVNERQMISPLAKTIWNFAKLNTPGLIYPEPDAETQTIGQQILSLFVVFGTDVYRNFRGINKSLEDQKFGAFISTDKSWLRLNSPNKKRIGGGHRVKKIELSDEWQSMAYPSDNNAGASYGQTYDYTISETQASGEVWTISSGVASNLPALGGDENPLMQPVFTEIKNIMVPNEESYNDAPIGESFFQSPNVGYKKVTVKSLSHANVTRTATGYTVNEFYTAYDYPTIIRQTELFRNHVEPKPFFSMFQKRHETKVKASQGYTIELNDMHGKPKAQYTYAEGRKEPMSWTKSLYQTDSSGSPNTLQNKVLTIAPDKTIKEKEIGVEYDFILDSRQQSSVTFNAGIEFNTEAMTLMIVPVVVPCILPSYSREDTEFKSSVGTKVIKKYGVLKETIAFQEGSTISTSNLLYDDQTGDVLLTSVQNEFNDNIYNLTYPAHWAYDGMGQAYKNQGFFMTGVEIQADNIKLPANLLSSNFLVPGDECLVSYPNGTNMMAWVYLGNGDKLNFIDENGQPLDHSKDVAIKVIRSGRRNMHNAPIASFTTLSNPLVKAASGYSISIANVINTEAMEYKEVWKTYMDQVRVYDCDTFTNKNYRNFVNFLSGLPNVQSLVKTKYEAGSPQLMRNDTLFYIDLATRKNIGGTFVYTTRDTFNFGDSVFLAYKYLGLDEEFHSDPFKFVEIVGIKNVIPRPTSIQLPGYDKFWTRVHRWSGPNAYLNAMGTDRALMDSLMVRLKFCMSTTDNDANKLYVSYLYSTNLYNSKYRFMNAGNECNCGFDFTFSKPNRYKTILRLYDFKPNDNTSLKCKAIVELENGTKDTLNVLAKTNCLKLMDCSYKCKDDFLEERVINPYRAALYGNWRPYKTHKYLGERTYQAASPNTRNDGVYTTASSYWNYNATTKKYEPNLADAKWVNASEIIAYTPYGNEVENRDALGNYSAAIFGYKNTLTTAVASNCRYTQLAFDGFEDYYVNFNSTASNCDEGHFNFRHTIGAGTYVTPDLAEQHSGNYSLKITPNREAVLERAVSLTLLGQSVANENEVKVARLPDDLGVFRPGRGKYVLGAWVKSAQVIGDTSYNNGLIEIELTDSNNVVTTISANTVGKIIEGWQRVEKVFEIPANTKIVKVRLKTGNYITWFDDIRIHTYNGNMKSYVYDEKYLKLRAELDENNYATFYEYDQEGSLIRVKKETERGIVTIKENRNHVKGAN